MCCWCYWVDRSSLRKSTCDKTRSTEDCAREREARTAVIRQIADRKHVADVRRLTQDELLAEAKITEKINLRSLGQYSSYLLVTSVLLLLLLLCCRLLNCMNVKTQLECAQIICHWCAGWLTNMTNRYAGCNYKLNNSRKFCSFLVIAVIVQVRFSCTLYIVGLLTVHTKTAEQFDSWGEFC